MPPTAASAALRLPSTTVQPASQLRLPADPPADHEDPRAASQHAPAYPPGDSGLAPGFDDFPPTDELLRDLLTDEELWDLLKDEGLWDLVPDLDADPLDDAEQWLAHHCPDPGAAEGICVPEAERVGFFAPVNPKGNGFAIGGAADRLAPGTVLAGLAARAWADGLEQLSDDGLIGLMCAWRRLSSWATAGEAAAVAELDRRRNAQVAAGADPHVAEHVGDEIAVPLTLTMRGADRLLDFACRLAELPLTSAALATGQIDRAKAYVITDELTGLDGAHAAAVEAALITRAANQTTGQLRAAARRAVLAADPSAARTRREKAQKEARVEVWDEHAGTAALAGRDLPPADVLAADKHIDAVAHQLRSAGAEGSLDQLRARVYTALLLGWSAESLLARLAPSTGAPEHGPLTAGAAPGQVPAGLSAAWPATGSGTGSLAALASVGSVNLTMPLATFLGDPEGPGDVPGFGPIPAEDAQALARAMATRPATRWCLTLTGPGGRALAHGCARFTPGRHPAGAADDWELSLTIKPLAVRSCDHRRESAGYRPAPGLRHLLGIRQRTCSFPGCRRAATRCDLDHTVPYDRGGRTCECNIAPLCRRHHRAKQAQGWQLDQPEPGVLTWRLPHGRTYRAEPGHYPEEDPAP